MRERPAPDLQGERQFEVVIGIRGNDRQDEESSSSRTETMRERIGRVKEDVRCLTEFYNIEVSSTRVRRLQRYFRQQLSDLKENEAFDRFDQSDKIDYLNLRNYLERNLRQLGFDGDKNESAIVLLPFASLLIRLCEDRQQMKAIDAKRAADDLFEAERQAIIMYKEIEHGQHHVSKNDAFRATNILQKLRSHLAEWFHFFKGYDPMFDWWVPEPYYKLDTAMERLSQIIREMLVGIKLGDEDAIVGEPIGRKALLTELDAEMIAYTPEELLKIADHEYTWCEAEMKNASQELGHEDWRDALEYVKNLYVAPGQQTQLIRDLADEATEYVKKHDLITVPPICEETWRMFMMSPSRQKVNPFFLGGRTIQVSYPTDTMDHEAKMMSMRGNNIHFSRSTVFHELIPGHHLQMYMNDRHRPYRRLFSTPFSIEGWALYWEFILWDKKFPETPKNRIGMLFWRMHRCARITFSIKFHLGLMTPQECIDLLVDKVGHERATAEGEVRRSFNGDYSPLYQCGYMIGALQLYSLRQELLGPGRMTEKEFHDRVMREGQMPIELLRALIREKRVTRDYKPSWKFYKSLE
ncbi:hypothetical protein NA57DRAFT_75252 [Rhizodiscina lignyota]|uniref:X-Pro dipeptidyl-peptidase n=1 Tax=Rhizodiscina lignyota TaxID=1504668 RepID=A0A9P4M9V1_9PEZI|nr:hypothetical protein NA57DRAFT_75252 [Rhizodiscina lignyota]